MNAKTFSLRTGLALLCLALALAFLAACSASATEAPAAEMPAAAALAEPTTAPQEAPAAAPAASGWDIPVLASTPIPEPFEMISVDRANAVRLLAVWGTAPFEEAIYTPDGQMIAAIASPGIFLYDANLAKTAWLNPGSDPVQLVVNPAGNFLIAGLSDGWLQIWSLQDQVMRYSQPAHPGSLTALAISPDGRTLATCGHGSPAIRLWDAADARQLAELTANPGPCTNLAFSPDNTWLAVGLPDGSVQVWDITARQLVQGASISTSPVTGLEFSPVSPGLLAAAAQDGAIQTWRVGADGTLVEAAAWQAQFPDLVDLAFSADGQWLAYTASDGLVQFQPASGSGLPFQIAAAGAPLSSLDFTPDSKGLLTAATTLQVWDIEQRSLLHEMEEIHRQPTSLAYSPDGALLVVGTSQGMIEEWWASDGSLVRQFGGSASPVARLAISPDGSRIASGSENGTLQVWSLGDGSLLMNLAGHQAAITGLSFSTDGAFLASSSNDGSVLIWSLADGANITSLSTGVGRPVGTTFSPDGALLAAPYDSGLLQLWQSGSWNLVSEIQTGLPLVQAGFLPALLQRILSASPSGELMLWDATSAGMLAGYPTGSRGLADLSISPSSELAALTGASGLTLAGLTQLRAIQPPEGESPAMAAGAFSPDGRFIATAGADGTIRIWGTAP